jgi:cytochrome c oxidase subunit 3
MIQALVKEKRPGSGGDGWGPNGDRDGSGGVFPLPTLKIGVWLFLGVATVLFSALLSAYLVRMGLPDWQPLPEPGVLWLNTALLILSSGALQLAWRAARRGRPSTMERGLLAGGVLAILFVAGQLFAWRNLQEMGYFTATNPSSSFFYLLTTIHGLHLFGGLVAWGRTALKAWQGAYTAHSHLGVELCAVYWHFLLLVWLVLFGLMLAT